MEGTYIVKENTLDMKNYIVHMLYDHILFKKMRLGVLAGKKEVMMIFDTPVTLKYQHAFLDEFRMDAILNAIKRRIYILDCFEGIDVDILHQDDEELMPEIQYQEHYLASVCRYSARKDEKMVLYGVKGYILLTEVTDDVLILLLAGELIHIGKNTSFGFGRYHLKFVDN